jgi:hypothetical protein
MKSIIRKRKRIASQRGAALVEAAFMSALFVILIFSAFFVYNLGRANIDVKSAAREEAWANAMDNCRSNGQSESEALPTGSTAQTGAITHDTTNASLSTQMSGTLSGHGAGAFIVTLVQGLVNVVAPLFPNPKGSTQTEFETVNYRIPNRYVGQTGHGLAQHTAAPAPGSGPASNAASGIQTRTYDVELFCNEAPTNGDIPILDVIAAAADAIVIGMAPEP